LIILFYKILKEKTNKEKFKKIGEGMLSLPTKVQFL